ALEGAIGFVGGALTEPGRINRDGRRRPVAIRGVHRTGAKEYRDRKAGCGQQRFHHTISENFGAFSSRRAFAARTASPSLPASAKTDGPTATNSAPVAAASRMDAGSLPASTRQGISTISAHQLPSVRLRGWTSARSS